METRMMLMPDVPLGNLYSVIGAAGIARLTAAFYRQVRHDDILAPLYPPDALEESERRLREFLVFRLGGPPRYIQERGHPRLRMRHAPFAIDQRARDRWVALMDNALHECEFAPETTQTLRTFFHDVATFLINRQEPPAAS
jgi:hemoglobin